MRAFKLLIAASLILAITGMAGANTVESSTMYFTGTLQDDGLGGYQGVFNMIDEDAENIGDDVGGFDVYARNGATAQFGNDPGGGPVWTPVTIANNDAWPTWTVDTPDWYQYSVEFYVDAGQQKWALRNHAGATALLPQSTPPEGVPMSGLMDWTSTMGGVASETEVGAYMGAGVPEIPGGAASMGGGAGAWDMDWSWGSEVVPLQYSDFEVELTNYKGTFLLTMTPIPEPLTIIGGILALGGIGGYIRRRRA